MENNNQDLNAKPPYKMITGMFDYEGAECAWQNLIERGYTKDEINLLMSQETHKTHFVNEDADTEIPDKTLLVDHLHEVNARSEATELVQHHLLDTRARHIQGPLHHCIAQRTRGTRAGHFPTVLNVAYTYG